MRVVLLMLTCLIVGACRRPPQQPVAMTPLPAAPEPEPEPEPEEPPPKPGPPKPTSDPPISEAGFGFGWQEADVRRECARAGVWSREGDYFTCSQPADDPGFPGKPVLAFCGERLCAIGIVFVPDAKDFESWNTAYEKMRDVLVQRHGPPSTQVEEFPEDCKNESFADCVDAGKAQKELTWRWDAHIIRLTLSKKLTGQGPAAIRFVSLPQTREAAASAKTE